MQILPEERTREQLTWEFLSVTAVTDKNSHVSCSRVLSSGSICISYLLIRHFGLRRKRSQVTDWTGHEVQNVVAFPIRPFKGSNRKRDDILRWAALRIALSDFEINLKLISKSLSAELSGTQRKMSSRFLLILLKDDKWRKKLGVPRDRGTWVS